MVPEFEYSNLDVFVGMEVVVCIRVYYACIKLALSWHLFNIINIIIHYYGICLFADIQIRLVFNWCSSSAHMLRFNIRIRFFGNEWWRKAKQGRQADLHLCIQTEKDKGCDLQQGRCWDLQQGRCWDLQQGRCCDLQQGRCCDLQQGRYWKI